MTTDILLLIGLLAVAMVMFWWERFPAEVIALGLLLTLALTGLLPADKAFEGFGSDTVIMILGLLILTAALERTGVIEIAGRTLLRYAGENPTRLLLIIMISAALVSAFMSNTAATAFFLPIVFGVAAKSKVSPSKLLLPLAFASILSSSVTLISTSTNVVVSGQLKRHGLEPMGMFELTPVGIPIVIAGLLYLFLVRRFIPENVPGENLTEQFGVRPYLSEVIVQPDSPLVGQTLAEADLGRELGLEVLRILRRSSASTQHITPRASTRFEAEDALLVVGTQQDLLKVKETAGIQIRADARLSDPDLTGEETSLAEAVILPGSPLIGRTLHRHRFRERHGLQVLGINHHGVNVVRKLSDTMLRLGDVLLLQGRRENIARLHESHTASVLGPVELVTQKRPRRQRAVAAVLIFVGVVAAVALQLLSLPLAAMLGVFLVFITGCLTPEEAYQEVEWKAIILIGSLLSLGVAMEHTGTAKYLAQQIVDLVGPDKPFLLLTAFFAMTVFLTQPMSNQAAAIVILPIAIQTAIHAGFNPRSFAMMIAVAASCSYLTPLEPACLMVYGPGRYRFVDFLKLGSFLTVLIYGLAILLVPRVWPLTAP